MNKITARIEKDKHGSGYWIIVEHKDKPMENTQMAITKNEIAPIYLACQDFMVKGE